MIFTQARSTFNHLNVHHGPTNPFPLSPSRPDLIVDFEMPGTVFAPREAACDSSQYFRVLEKAVGHILLPLASAASQRDFRGKLQQEIAHRGI